MKILLTSVGFAVYVFGTIRASRSIHRRLVDALLGSTLRYQMRSNRDIWLIFAA